MSEKNNNIKKQKNPTVTILALMIPILALMIPITAISQYTAVIIFGVIAIFMFRALKSSIKTEEKINTDEVITTQKQMNKLEDKLNEIDKEMHLMREAIILNEKRIPAPVKSLGEDEEKSNSKQGYLKKKLEI